MIWGWWGQGVRVGCGLWIAAVCASTAFGAHFDFDRDTLAFANSTVFEYHGGVAQVRRGDAKEKTQRYTRRCFVMSRSVLQFLKFARFDPHGAPLDDKELAHRVRNVTRRPPWHDPLPENKRIVFPGYTSLRQLSKSRGRILQQNMGLGWPAYARIGNFRMFFEHSTKYQEKTRQELNASLARNEFFVAYLSDYPILHINHSVLVYARKPGRAGGEVDRYVCYDPNHPDAPRELKWLASKRAFEYEKDEEFVGGFTRVFHVYGKFLQ
ncbi:MAG: hypothetical protein QOH39_1653 [Verrucomicrobiota bacterium]